MAVRLRGDNSVGRRVSPCFARMCVCVDVCEGQRTFQLDRRHLSSRLTVFRMVAFQVFSKPTSTSFS